MGAGDETSVPVQYAMTRYELPFSQAALRKIATRFPTPFHIYDEAAIRRNARDLLRAFSWAPGFSEFFAVKATPNPYLLKILNAEGFGADCSSLAELLLAERVGIIGERVMFTSNDTPAQEFVKARETGAIINLDDLSHLAYLEQHAGLPQLLSFRYNPGLLREGNAIIGHPEEAKYGLTRDQMSEAYRAARDKGVERFGIHTMVVSNELNPRYFAETAGLLFNLAVSLSQELGITFEFANIGGGVGIPYRPEQHPVDLVELAEGIRAEYDGTIRNTTCHPLRLYMECGRAVTGPYGYLVSRVRHIKRTYRNFAGLDACMTDLMRPAIYGAYHHITVPGKENLPCTARYDVTGSLCENNDKFAVDRELPELSPGDIVVIHDAGAHGHAMGFNYNGKLRSAELLLRENGEVVEIRRAETTDDYFATLNFDNLNSFPV